MKFVVPRQEFSNLVNQIQGVVSIKPPMPALGNFLIEADDGQIKITATDMTVAMRLEGAAKVITAGSTTLPAKKMAQLLKELNAPYIEIQVDARDIAKIESGSSVFSVHGISKEQFPVLPDFSDAVTFSLPQNVLKELLSRTSFATSRDEAKHVLTGLSLQIANQKIVFISTDGHRLARATASLDIPEEFQAECILPLKAVDEIMKVLEHTEKNVTCHLLKDKIVVDTGTALILSKLILGDYPSTEKIIPRQSDRVIEIHKEELLSLLRQVTLFAESLEASARFKFVEGKLHINVNALELGDGDVSMEVPYTGADFDISFSPSSLKEILRYCKKDTIFLGVTDRFNPGVISEGPLALEHTELPSPMFLIMPKRVSQMAST